MTSNTLAPNIRAHTTHFACGERLQEYGSGTVGCCCTGHQCQTDAGTLNWMDKSAAPTQIDDFASEPNPRAAQRANIRNHVLDQHAKIQEAISELGSMYIEAGEELGLQEDNEVASALSDLAVTSQRVIDKIENQLNKQMLQEQKEAQQ